MKFALVVCFAALAAAEPEAKADAKADPWVTYGYGYHPYSYGYRAYGYGYPPVYGSYGKRSADAERLYSTYGASTYGAYPYGLYNGIVHDGLPYGFLRNNGKRSADAEPEADVDAYYGNYGYGARPYYGYYGGYRGYYYGNYGYGAR